MQKRTYFLVSGLNGEHSIYAISDNKEELIILSNTIFGDRFSNNISAKCLTIENDTLFNNIQIVSKSKGLKLFWNKETFFQELEDFYARREQKILSDSIYNSIV